MTVRKVYVVVEADMESDEVSIYGKPYPLRKDAVTKARDLAEEHADCRFYIAELKEYYIGEQPIVKNKIIRRYEKIDPDDTVVIHNPSQQPKVLGD